MLETEGHTSKPTNAGSVRAHMKLTDLTINELANALVSGHSMYCHESVGMKAIDWRSQKIFALDFDDNSDHDEIIHRLIDCGIKPCFGYTTFSDSAEWHKFRLVFNSNTLITIPAIRRVITHAFMIICPECDKACKDAARLIYGGKSIIYEDYDATFDPITLITETMPQYLQKNNLKNYSQNLNTYCKNVGLNICNNYPDIRPTTKDKYLEELHECQDSNFKENAFTSIIYNIELNLKSLKNDIDSCDWARLHNASFSGKVLYQDWKTAQYYVFNFSKPEKIKTNAKGETKISYKPEKRKEDPEQDLIQRFDFNELKNNCQLYRDIINGDYWAFHEDIFAIATNFAYIKGGCAEFEDIISKTIDHDESLYNEYKVYNMYHTIDQCKDMGYSPMRCENFCPFKDTCKNRGKNMLSANSKKLNNDIRKLEDSEIDYISLDEAAANTQLAIEEAMNADDHKIYCIKAPTGIGKTDIYTKMNLENTCIALPNHTLKNEVNNRIHEGYCAYGETPRFTKLVCKQKFESPDSEINTEYNKFVKVGAYSEAYNFLDNRLKELKRQGGISHSGITTYLNNYLDNIKKLRDARTVITTHTNMLHSNYKNIEKYIIDEDITPSLLTITEYKQEDFDTVIHQLIIDNGNDDDTAKLLRKLVNNIAQMDTEQYLPFPKMKIEGMKKLNKAIVKVASSLTTNIPNILESSFMIKTYDPKTKKYIVYTAQSNLNLLKDSKTYIILSATLDESVCRYLFKDRLVFTDIGNVKIDSEENCTTGDIYQWCRYSTSRQAIIKNPDRVFTQINTSIPDIDTSINLITFANCEKIFKDHGFTNAICHFGACSGIDAYAGQDLLVVGTPHINDITYMLYALMLGKHLSNAQCDDENMKRQNIIRNGYEFAFMTYDNEFLQTIQLWLIEQELYQAIGRARALRNSCKVYVFSNLPLVNTKVQDCE